VAFPEQGYRLRIFVNENHRYGDALLHEWLVLKAKETGVAGATVIWALSGFGTHRRLRRFNINKFSVDLPVVIEFVDTQEKIEHFLATVDTAMGEGMVTAEEVRSRFYGRGAWTRV
jgi:uncharacterized protein